MLATVGASAQVRTPTQSNVRTSEVGESPTVRLDTAEPPDDGHDWLQLTNGEWLQGRAEELRHGELAFKSDHFDVQTVDFKDVERLFLRKPAEFALLSLERFEGTGLIADGKAVIQTVKGIRVIPCDHILSLVSTDHDELRNWSLHASFGVNRSRGNTNTNASNGRVTLERRDALTRFRSDYLGNYSRARKVVAAHSHRANSEFDLFLSPKYFLVLPSCTLEYDRFKNIQARATPVVGSGIHLAEDAAKWSVALAAGYQYSRYVSVRSGDDRGAHQVAVALGTAFEVEVKKDATLKAEYSGLVVPTELGLTTHHAVFELSNKLQELLNVSLRVVWNRMERPVATDDGVRPKKNDYQIIMSVGVDLG